ncbi:hypothetical protein FOA43_004573 [Brettanomyces nanus]|uniref:Cation efflux protein transmembrane domain-containing protein n=1 Tax=Eeniella nana TaxID=13502 RepID=A0A875RY41_EENNA|nr:uncharacterized protein FOA43_004573 [Brettanomyces nanus]QPG77167.1 hypothetical protein FOA43_004573 [Brettanomyces nanus]
MSLAQKIVVFGGNGFLGRRICQASIRKGFNVTSVSMSGKEPKLVTPSDSEWIKKVNWTKGDVFKPETYRNEIKDAVGVVHSIGILLENQNYKKVVSSTDDTFGVIESFFTQPSGNPMKKRPKTGAKDDDNGEPIIDMTYERMNKESALVLADALIGCNKTKPAFVYISADRGFPGIPSGYIESKRQAEYELYQLQPDIRPILMRPGFMFDQDAENNGNFRQSIKKLLDVANVVNSKVLFNLLDGIIRPAVSTQTVADWAVRMMQDKDFHGPVLMDQMLQVKSYYTISEEDPLADRPYTPITGRSRLRTPNASFFHSDTNLNNARRSSVSVSNPATPLPEYKHRLSMFVDPKVNPTKLYERVHSLVSMRPYRLIGGARRFIDWSKYLSSEEKLRRVPKGPVHHFYTEQNELIERYIDVDKLLDTGIHYEMIQNYEDNTSSENSESENDEDDRDGDHTETQGDVEDYDDDDHHHHSMQSATAPFPSGEHHASNNAVPANIDSETARVLGVSEKSDNSIVLTAIYINFAINILLLLAKMVVVYTSRSMSIIASLVDSVLDFMSTLIIYFANKYAAIKSSRFPIGRRRLEPIGVLVFSIVIIISFLQVLISSVERLFDRDHTIVTLSASSITIMLSTVLVKFLCYLWCSSIENSSVEALAEDAKTDVVFNTFSLVFPLIEWAFQIWWVDATGASLLCLYVIFQWGMITFEHIDHLSGSHASMEDYHEILYLVTRFSDKISAVKNYRIYHQGDLVNVEVDIVISDRNLNLRDCHDLGESLQYAIETLPFVERAFVHLDYKVRNYVGHIDK